MANYAVTTTQSENKQYQSVVAALETAIEAVDATKVIRHYSIVYRADEGLFVGTVVIDT